MESEIEVSLIAPFLSPANSPLFPLSKDPTALFPHLLANIRSEAEGFPPRRMCPRTATLVSNVEFTFLQFS